MMSKYTDDAIKLGIYRHYKGQLYQVLGIAHDANDESRTCVVYIGLQLDKANPGPRMAVRTIEDFLAYIDPKTGGKALDWATPMYPRFDYIGMYLEEWMVGDAKQE